MASPGCLGVLAGSLVSPASGLSWEKLFVLTVRVRGGSPGLPGATTNYYTITTLPLHFHYTRYRVYYDFTFQPLSHCLENENFSPPGNELDKKIFTFNKDLWALSVGWTELLFRNLWILRSDPAQLAVDVPGRCVLCTHCSLTRVFAAGPPGSSRRPGGLRRRSRWLRSMRSSSTDRPVSIPENVTNNTARRWVLPVCWPANQRYSPAWCRLSMEVEVGWGVSQARLDRASLSYSYR